MKKKESWIVCEGIIADIYTLLNEAPPKEKRNLAIAICQNAASYDDVIHKDVFEPLRILSEAQKELQSIIAEEVDRSIESNLLDCVKGVKK
jgi:hypothetical protein